MRKYYFLIGSVIGLMLAALMAYAMIGRYFFEMFKIVENQKYNGIIPIAVGSLSTLVAALIFDLKNKKKSVLAAGILIPVSIFAFGSLIGCIFNFLVNGNMTSINDWFSKPLFALMLFGLPASILIGVVYFYLNRILARR